MRARHRPRVARLGTVDVKGIEGGTKHTERAIRYTTKYLTKDLVGQTLIRSPEQHGRESARVRKGRFGRQAARAATIVKASGRLGAPR
jgi:hypothetical protein